MKFEDRTDYEGDPRKWEVREDGKIIAKDLNHRQAADLAAKGYRRSCHVQEDVA